MKSRGLVLCKWYLKGLDELYLTKAVIEYASSAIPEFEGKKFLNVAMEGFSLTTAAHGKEHFE